MSWVSFTTSLTSVKTADEDSGALRAGKIAYAKHDCNRPRQGIPNGGFLSLQLAVSLTDF